MATAQCDGKEEIRKEAIPLLRAAAKGGDDPSKMETRLPNGIPIYGPIKESEALAKVMNEIPELWTDKEMARIPEEHWMTIPLIESCEDKYKPGGAKVYPVRARDRAQIDADFHKLHEQGRMSWSNKTTLFSFPYFVVWRTTARRRNQSKDGSGHSSAKSDLRC